MNVSNIIDYDELLVIAKDLKLEHQKEIHIDELKILIVECDNEQSEIVVESNIDLIDMITKCDDIELLKQVAKDLKLKIHHKAGLNKIRNQIKEVLGE